MNENLLLSYKLLPIETFNTLFMVFSATFFSFLLGVPLGVALFLTGRSRHKVIFKILGLIINFGRTLPFAILMIAIIPFTRFIVGTSLGTVATLVPLSLAGIPFVARLVEMALKEIRKDLLEAAHVMGATTYQLITRVALPEILPALIRGATLTAINLVAYSAMAGIVGGGGLGKVAIQYGYQRFNGFIMLETVVVLLLLVEAIQWLGGRFERKVTLKRGL